MTINDVVSIMWAKVSQSEPKKIRVTYSDLVCGSQVVENIKKPTSFEPAEWLKC